MAETFTLTGYADGAAVKSALDKAGTAVQQQSNSIIKLGSTDDYFQVAEDGTLTLVKNATAWDDLDFAMTIRTGGGEDPPQWTQISNTGIYSWAFHNNDEAFFQRQIPHNFKVGALWYPHIHWMPTTTATYTGTWTLNLTGHKTSLTPSNAPLFSTVTRTGSFNVSATAWQGHLTQLDNDESPIEPLDGSDWGISTILFARLSLTLSSGTSCLLSGFDLHGEIDSFGSKEEYVK